MPDEHLRCDALFLAEFARFSQNGALNAFGIFDQLTASQFPSHTPEFSVCAKLGADVSMRGQSFGIQCDVIDPDGVKIAGKGSIAILGGHPSAGTVTAWVVLSYSPSIIRVPGLYTVNFAAAGHAHWVTVLPVIHTGDRGWQP